MKRQKKIIDKIIIDEEEVHEKGEIKKAFLKYFKQLYKKQESSMFDVFAIGLHKFIQEESEHLEELATT